MNTFLENLRYNFAPDLLAARENLAKALRDFLNNEKLKHRIRRERMQLQSISDAQLSDIGIDRFHAEQEALRRDIPVERIKPSTL